MTRNVYLLFAASTAYLLSLASVPAYPVARPPTEFSHAAATMRLLHLPVMKVDERCRVHMRTARVHMRNARGRIGGCALQGVYKGQQLCIVILPHRRSVSQAAYAGLLQHERAHCNGWNH